MPTSLDFHRAKAIAYKKTLEATPGAQKQERASITIAKQVNELIEAIKAEHPEAEPHLPATITWNNPFANRTGWCDVKLVEMEMLLNQIIAVLDVLKAGR